MCTLDQVIHRKNQDKGNFLLHQYEKLAKLISVRKSVGVDTAKPDRRDLRVPADRRSGKTPGQSRVLRDVALSGRGDPRTGRAGIRKGFGPNGKWVATWTVAFRSRAGPSVEPAVSFGKLARSGEGEGRKAMVLVLRNQGRSRKGRTGRPGSHGFLGTPGAARKSPSGRVRADRAKPTDQGRGLPFGGGRGPPRVPVLPGIGTRQAGTASGQVFAGCGADGWSLAPRIVGS